MSATKTVRIHFRGVPTRDYENAVPIKITPEWYGIEYRGIELWWPREVIFEVEEIPPPSQGGTE